VNPNTQTKEFSLRDPDGYYVTISALCAACLGNNSFQSLPSLELEYECEGTGIRENSRYKDACGVIRF